MQTIRRAAAVLMYPAILCLGVACERADTPTSSPPARAPGADLTAPTPNTDWLVRALSLGVILSDDPRAVAWTDEDESDEADDPIKVVPFDFDPFKTSLVRARWLRGIGCPTGATAFIDDPLTPAFDPKPVPYTDNACMTGDPKENPGRNEGLLLVKTGPTGNFASAGAELKGVKGITLTELGYDIRSGSHCGAGAPRFNVVTSDGVNHFVGCSSPAGAPTAVGMGWTRLRWDAALLATAFPPISPLNNEVQSITIIFDEGQDAMGGPDMFGLAVLDNIDVNGTMVGRGPGN
jgi:hypothetical protein